MIYNVTEFLSDKVTKFNIIEISDRVYIDYGNELDFSDVINHNIFYDDKSNKVFIDNVLISENKTYVFMRYKYNSAEKILTINNETRKQA